jgi:predicted RNA-binding Zn-ribbon protein involved in translation (DUF1610 family)
MATIILSTDSKWWMHYNIGCRMCGIVFQLEDDDTVIDSMVDASKSVDCPNCGKRVILRYNDVYKRLAPL